MSSNAPDIVLDEADAAHTNSAPSRSSTTRSASSTGPLERVNSQTRFSVLPEYTPIEETPPPPYSDSLGSLKATENGFGTTAKIAEDGRVAINIKQESKRFSNLLAPALRNQLQLNQQEAKPYIPPTLAAAPGDPRPPKLNVVIHVVGSRGDVQPFVALGKVLKEEYGHRVRLATHAVFKDFVEENGLEFFKIGGDPAELMAFMVKNPGLMPGFDSLRNGDVGKRRKGMYEIIVGCWRSCYEAGDGSGVEASDENFDSGAFAASPGQGSASPFVADAIIANPPSFAHIHCAEKLGIPLHLMFTMPWSPTQSFPHPLANIESSNIDVKVASFMTYALVDMMTWQGLGDLINSFRRRKLGLESISIIWAPGLLERHHIPYTYCWSPALIPKPADWGPHIDISGFYFLSLASNFTPAPDLAEFLAAGSPPVYIGFGSIVVDDPNAMTQLIFEAVRKTGQRALVSKGWGGFGGDDLSVPEGVFMLGNVPHDWLFKQVSCVVHHGGAGTTAAGIALGRPTVIVPFFGDQPFWGDMVARAGAGPTPIHHKELTADRLAAAIMEALRPEALERAGELGAKVRAEQGTDVGAKSFHKHLPLDSLRCLVAPTQPACWRLRRTEIRLSAFAAAVLVDEGMLSFDHMKLYRPTEYVIEDGPPDPISGGAGAIIGTIGSVMMGVADLPSDVLKAMHIANSDPEAKAKRKEKSSNQGMSSRSSTDIKNPDADGSVRPPLSSHNSEAAGGSTSLGVFTPVSSEDHHTVTKSGSHQSLGDTSSRSPFGSRATSRSRDPSHSKSRASSPAKAAPRTKSSLNFDNVVGSGSSFGKIVGASVRSPMDFTIGLARGFHNAPKLYGDESVRPQEKVTGFHSGLKAAGKEFGLGMYDGISGLVTQPFKGARKEGTAGFFKGIGKGVGGIVLKPGAAVFGMYGYTLQGISKEIGKLTGMSVQNYIVASRMAQGIAELGVSTPEERADVIRRWFLLQEELKQPRSKRNRPDSSKGAEKDGQKEDFFSRFGKTSRMSFEARKKLANERKERAYEAAEEEPQAHGQPFYTSLSSTTESHDFEDAIQQSVLATSNGDKEEDKAIARALRASVTALRTSSHQGHSEHEAYERAVAASVAEASRMRAEASTSQSAGADNYISAADEKANLERITQQRLHDERLAQTLRQSLAEPHVSRNVAADTPTSSSEIDLSDHDIVDTDSDGGDADYRRALELSMQETERNLNGRNTNDDENDEELRRAIRESKSLQHNDGIEQDENLKRILRESKHLHEEYEENLKKQMSEEEIMLEYARKQSLLDEERMKALQEARARKARESNLTGGQGSSSAAAAAESGREDDEDLKRAIEESLKIR